MTWSVIVFAKAPVAGRVKTRMCPPCEPDQAARLAEAALVDTLDAARGVRGVDRVLVLDGQPGSWVPPGFRIVPQRGAGMAERLAHAFDDIGTGGLLIGMDTPQLPTAALEAALRELLDADAVLGASVDGGWWAIGLRAPNAAVFTGVPMSTSFTHRAQLARLRGLGLRTSPLPPARDVDDFDDALAVATDAPNGRFAAVVQEVAMSLEQRPAARAAP
jgi:uncharacterized protein